MVGHGATREAAAVLRSFISARWPLISYAAPAGGWTLAKYCRSSRAKDAQDWTICARSPAESALRPGAPIRQGVCLWP